MTTHTPAPAQQAVLTDDEIRSIWIEHGLDDEAVEDFARAIESALLSKLRAPVADERSIEVRRLYYKDANIPMTGYRFIECRFDNCTFSGIASGRQFERCAFDAALASAPVAGEAQPVAWLYRDCKIPGRHLDGYQDRLSATKIDHYYVGPDGKYVKGVPLYAARQASEADYVQTVPEHCDRILWQGRYYALPLDAAPQVSGAVQPPMPDVMKRPDWLRGYADTCEFQARSTSHGTMYSTAKALREIAGWLDSCAALSAQPGAQKKEGA